MKDKNINNFKSIIDKNFKCSLTKLVLTPSVYFFQWIICSLLMAIAMATASNDNPIDYEILKVIVVIIFFLASTSLILIAIFAVRNFAFPSELKKLKGFKKSYEKKLNTIKNINIITLVLCLIFLLLLILFF